MVIIGVKEGYREARMVAMRGGLCRSGNSCGELVERGVSLGKSEAYGKMMWKSLFHVEHFGVPFLILFASDWGLN